MQPDGNAHNASGGSPGVLLTPTHNTVHIPQDAPAVLWLRFRVPADSEAGIYSGEILFSDEKGREVGFPLALRVYDTDREFVPDNMAAGLEIWQSCGGASLPAGVSMFGEAWWGNIVQELRYLSEMGNRTIQVGRAYFDWRRDGDKQWQFDFSRFDRYVKAYGDVWRGNDISYVGMVNCAGDDVVFYTGIDEVLQRETAGPGNPLYDDAWSSFLSALSSRIAAANGRLTVWVADRPNVEQVERIARAVAIVREAAPDAQVAVTIDNLTVFGTLLGTVDVAAIPLPRYQEFAEVFELREGTVDSRLVAYPDVGAGFSWLASTSDSSAPFEVGYVSQLPPLTGLLVPAWDGNASLQPSLQSERLMLGIEAGQIVRQAGLVSTKLHGPEVSELALYARSERLRALKSIEMQGMLQ